MGEYMVGLVGEASYQPAIRRIGAGAVVRLVHEPSNRFDNRAVQALVSNGQTIGYLPRDHWLARVIIDEDADVMAIVEEVTGGKGAKASRGVVLKVFTGADARAAMLRPMHHSGAAHSLGRLFASIFARLLR